MKKTPLFATTLLATSLLATGCTVISSHSKTHVSGVTVNQETLSKVEPGHTTKSWLISALGEPNSITPPQSQDGVEILRYTSKQVTDRHAHLLLIFNDHSTNVKEETYLFEFKDGILNRYWREVSKR